MSAVARRAALALLAAAPAAAQSVAWMDGVWLFHLTGPEGRITFGLTRAERGALGEGPVLARIARRLEEEAPLTAWLYALTRLPEGGMRYVATGRAALPRGIVDAFPTAVVVLPPPGG